jgi:hypothetical protein
LQVRSKAGQFLESIWRWSVVGCLHDFASMSDVDECIISLGGVVEQFKGGKAPMEA